jgi:hypothetical protein
MVCVMLVVACVAGCHRVAPARSVGAGSSPPATTPPPVQFPLPKAQLIPHMHVPCVSPAHGFSCLMQQRIRKVGRYLASQPGEIGVVLHDRQTGATWENAKARLDLPAASTVKLAMITDLLLRHRSGALALGGYDWDLVDSVLRESSDTAADQLWFTYEDGSFLQRIQSFGMRTASFTSGSPYWGFMYCSARDLDNLMNYVLTRIPAHDRDFITDRMRHVAPIQQWGVWGAGPDHDPGNKDGWEDDGGVWVVNTVGFAGRNARYTLAIMDDLGGAADFHQGTVTLDQVASLLFRGRFGPVPTVEATP